MLFLYSPQIELRYVLVYLRNPQFWCHILRGAVLFRYGSGVPMSRLSAVWRDDFNTSFVKLVLNILVHFRIDLSHLGRFGRPWRHHQFLFSLVINNLRVPIKHLFVGEPIVVILSLKGPGERAGPFCRVRSYGHRHFTIQRQKVRTS